MQTTEEFYKELHSISDKELIEKADRILGQLCKTGARSFTMTVPPRTSDSDIILAELIKRFERLIEQPSALVSAEDVLKNFIQDDNLPTHRMILDVDEIINLMEEYHRLASQPQKVSDEVIEKWAAIEVKSIDLNEYRYDELIILGAKAMRDNKIK